MENTRKPVSRSAPESLQLDRAAIVSRLVQQLGEVAPLIKRLDSLSTSARYREALRTLVGQEELATLALNLLHLTSEELWGAAHTKQVIPPELMQRIKALGVLDDEDVDYP